MADSSDVENALVAAITAACAGLTPVPVVDRGWPSAADLTAAEEAGQPLITVFQRTGFARNTSRYPTEEIEQPTAPVTLTVQVTPDTATFAGTCSPDQIAGFQVGTTAWVTRCVPGDTPAAVAARLAAASGGAAYEAAVVYPGLTVARTGRDGVTLTPTRQQELGFMVVVWCSTPAQRDLVASTVDGVLSNREFLILADNSAGRLRWSGTMSTDRAENANTYRRDLFVSVDYATTIRRVRPTALFAGATIDADIPLGALAPSS